MKPRIGNPLVDTNHSIAFEFNGLRYCAHPGDTLASALMANDVQLLARSSKYHRPRGLLADGFEETNAIVEIGKGDKMRPNVPATIAEVQLDLIARSQNHWGSLQWDLLRALDYFAPFLRAGSRYKTMMWPRSFWKSAYEPSLRRQYGIGELLPDFDANAQSDELHCDLLIIGSGLAGLTAALQAGKAGADVIIADRDFLFGGRLTKDQGQIDGKTYRDWRSETLNTLQSMPNVKMLARAQVIRAQAPNHVCAVERSSGGDQPDGLWNIYSKATILATGATERPIPFANNDRPGIMLASSVRSYLNRYGVLPGRKIAIFTNNDEGWRLAHDLINLGIQPAAIIDPREDNDQDADCPIYRAHVIKTKGGARLQSIVVKSARKSLSIDCDCLAVSGGFDPNFEIAKQLGVGSEFDHSIAAFSPQNKVKNLYVVGAANGKFTDHEILQDVSRQTKNALKSLGMSSELGKHKAQDNPYHIEPIWSVRAQSRAFLDFQNDITVAELKQAIGENFQNYEAIQNYTRLGTGADQGQTAKANTIGILHEITGKDFDALSDKRANFTSYPARISTFGAGAMGQSFAPSLELPTQGYLKAKGAKFAAVGLWQIPSHYPTRDETIPRQACDREVAFVRNAAGVCDLSNLGQFRISGSDAKSCIERVCKTDLTSLKKHKICRVSIFERDNTILDFGTCTNIDGDAYLLTTSAERADAVQERFLSAVGKNSDCQIHPIGRETARIAISGPKAREILSAEINMDISGDILPNMSMRPAKIDGAPAEIYRISFTGQLGFEIALPSDIATDFIKALTERAEALGGGVFGLSAAKVLRLEKGYASLAELEEGVKLADLKPSGKPTDSARKQMVGIKPIGAVKRLLAGSLIIDVGEDPAGAHIQGHASSVCYSPSLGHMIGLAMIENGHARIGEKIRAVDLVRDFDTLCEIVSPKFYDPKDEIMQG